MTSKTEGGTTTNYTYDFESMMSKAGTKTYARDPFERAASSTVGTTTTNYLFDGTEAVRQKTGSTAATYYTRGLGDQIISSRTGTSTPSYYHHDAIGSVVGLSTGANALTDSYSYTAFGNQRARTGTSTQPYQYLENSYDSQSKLYDFHARMYDPSTGRFLSKDPVSGYAELPQTLNPYAYGRSNPLTYPDPYGQDTVGVCVSVSGGFALGGIVQKCYVTDGRTIKETRSYGIGGQSPSVGLTFGPQYSTATCANNLKGWGACDGMGGGEAVTGQMTVSGGKNAKTGKGYLIFDPQVGPGLDFPIPVEGYAGGAYTAVGNIPLLTDVAEYYLNDRANKSPCT